MQKPKDNLTDNSTLPHGCYTSSLLLSQMIPFLITADNAVFRPNTTMLTDQMRMELLVADLPRTARARLIDETGEFCDACTWPDIRCNQAREVICIEWGLQQWLHGKVNLDILPAGLLALNLSHDFQDGQTANSISGTISTHLLPPYLGYLNVSMNAFEGNFNFTALPEALFTLNLSKNAFTGEVPLEFLPKSMQSMKLNRNQFFGKIQLERLPEGFRELDLGYNRFIGEITLEALPAGLTHLSLAANSFEGKINLRKLPADISYLNLSSNRFHGEVDLSGLPDWLAELDLSCNKFTGRLQIPQLPVWMRKLRVGGNYFEPVAHRKKLPECVEFSVNDV